MHENHSGNTVRAIGAGFIATLAMTMLIYMAPLMGMPNMDIAAMLGTPMTGGQVPAVMSGVWWLGMVIHFMMGTILFPLVYAFVAYGLLPGKPWARGLVWGVLLWAVMQVMPLPMMGKGFFASNTPQPLLFVMGTLTGHLVYGGLLGLVAGQQVQKGWVPQQARR